LPEIRFVEAPQVARFFNRVQHFASNLHDEWKYRS